MYSSIAWSLKTLPRLLFKTLHKYDEVFGHVLDVARLSMTFSSMSCLKLAVKLVVELFVAAGCAVEAGGFRFKNRLVDDASASFGYRDALLNVRHPLTGHVGEVQFHIAPIYGLKGEMGHKMYKWLRRLDRPDDEYKGGLDADGHPHGRGTYSFANGCKATGQWDHGRLHGSAVYAFASGDKYHGQFDRSAMTGRGVLVFSEGGWKEGTFVNGALSGKACRQVHGNGDACKGEFERGVPHGRAVYTFASGSFYDGEFVDGEKSGTGVMDRGSNDSESYRGQWLLGLQHGQGVITRPDGMTIEGEWQQGEPVGKHATVTTGGQKSEVAF
jgi:hypothetical protein